jgi:hypothetical protein
MLQPFTIYILQSFNERIKERKGIFEQEPLRMSQVSASVKLKRSESIGEENNSRGAQQFSIYLP